MSEELCLIPISPHVPPEERVPILNDLALQGAEDERVRQVTRETIRGLVGDREIAEALLRRVHEVPFWAYPPKDECFAPAGKVLERGGDCFPLDQKIIVKARMSGKYEMLPIGDLRHSYGDYEALSYNFEAGAYEFRSITGFVDKGIRPIAKARLSNGTDLVSTDDHKFWSVDGVGSSEKKIRRLSVRTMGEYAEVMKAPSHVRTGKGRIVQASQIPSIETVKINPSRAYLAGIYAAEGYFDGKHTCISQHKSDVRKRIESALSDEEISFRYVPAHGKTEGSGAYYSLHGGAANPVVLMMRSQGKNSFDMTLPNDFFSAGSLVVETMMAAHADGDAWKQKSPENYKRYRPGLKQVYVTSSDVLMEQLRFGLLMLGKPSYAYRYENHGGSGRRPIWRLHEYNESASRLMNRRNVTSKLGLDGLTFGTVRNVESAGEARVCCIEVEGNHNFFLSDGTLVSNCDNLSILYSSMCLYAGVPASVVWINQPKSQLNHVSTVVFLDGNWWWADPSIKGARIGETPYEAAKRTGNGAPLGMSPAGQIEINTNTAGTVRVPIIGLVIGAAGALALGYWIGRKWG